MTKKSLKEKTISGMFWSSSELVANRGIKFLIQIVLARLLLPEHFGIIGMITVFIAVSQSIVNSGFKNALIREKDSSQEDYSTVFYFNLIVALLLYVILYVAAPFISNFFEEPKLINVLRVMSVVIIINAFGLIQRTILIKKIDFKTQTKISFVSAVVAGVIAIVFAFYGYGVWSLVINIIVVQAIQSILLCLSNKWIPSFVFSLDSFKRLFGFGWKLLVSGLIDTLYKNIYYVIIGKFFSTIDLGFYTNAQKIRDVASHSITTSVQKVSYPVLSSIQDNDNRLKAGYRKIIKNSVYITFPLMIGLAAAGESFILVVFGEKWLNSIVYLQILCFAGMLFPLQAINLNILQVKGRSDLFLKLEIIKKIVGICLICFVILFKLGIIALIWAAVMNSFISYYINSYYSGKLLSYSTKDQIKDIALIFLISILMGLIVYFIGFLICSNILIKLVVQILTAIVTYIGFSKIFKIEEFNTIYDLIDSLLKKFKLSKEFS